MPDDPQNAGNPQGNPGQESGTPQSTLESAPASAPAETPKSEPTSEKGSWFDGLPDGLKGEASLQTFKGKDIAALAESHVHAQKMIGGSIRLPKEDAPEEEKSKVLNEVYDKLGRPKEPAGYQYERDLPEGIDADPNTDGAFRDLAHKIGLSQGQVKELVKYYDGVVRQQVEGAIGSTKEAQDKCREELQKEWQGAYPRNLALAKRTIEVTAPAGLMNKITATGLGDDPDFIRWVARVGRDLQEDGIVHPDSSVSSAADLDKELSDLLGGGKEGPYLNINHPEHDKAVKRVKELMQMKHNEV